MNNLENTLSTTGYLETFRKRMNNLDNTVSTTSPARRSTARLGRYLENTYIYIYIHTYIHVYN